MATGSYTSTWAVGGLTGGNKITKTASGQIGQEVSLPAGKSGTLTTRTDDDTGIATVASGHGITDSDYVDVYWSGGVRYGMDVTATDATTISVNLGSGDVLPAQDTAIVITPRVEIDVDFDGDNVEIIAVSCSQRSHIEFTENDDTSILAKELIAAEGWFWAADQGVANPLTGNAVGLIQATNGSTTATTLYIGVLYEST